MDKTMIPKLKKKVTDYLIDENGKISPSSILKAGAFLTAIAVGTALSAKDAKGIITCNKRYHRNQLLVKYDANQGIAYGAHSHHQSNFTKECNPSHSATRSYEARRTETVSGSNVEGETETFIN